ncbi:hypothetical protein K431DRAFT_296884 [Polychaeton citri CBS 116435]|uniref:Uncharacterized protein n=1 Tax=Polychaeton citri CBS 116435 TaxID=1314669 RepID=A0A9P4Q2S4_9PEZI|nr:hypothetical protein K431DRAFT_296884 [Polychaeton citri CBS 116435]
MAGGRDDQCTGASQERERNDARTTLSRPFRIGCSLPYPTYPTYPAYPAYPAYPTQQHIRTVHESVPADSSPEKDSTEHKLDRHITAVPTPDQDCLGFMAMLWYQTGSEPWKADLGGANPRGREQDMAHSFTSLGPVPSTQPPLDATRRSGARTRRQSHSPSRNPPPTHPSSTSSSPFDL